MTKTVKKPLKTALKALLITVAALLAVALIYVGYVIFSYSRIEDNQHIYPEGKGVYATVTTGKEYTAVTQNIGFGAYRQDFSFFMDGGTESVAISADSVRELVIAAANKVAEYNPDFILFQEVDTDSTRSYHIDQSELLKNRFKGYSSTFAVNYHSAFLMYPLTQPHGASNSGILTVSKANITSALRRSLPISTSFSKFLDLDRCYSVSRVYVDNGRELVIYNVHTSAYGGSDEIRTAQINMLVEDMTREYEKGNYIVCGGDFNHDFPGDSLAKLNNGASPEFNWAQPFPAELLPDFLIRCTDYTGEYAPTCRNCDIPYIEGNLVFIVDGFIVSDNVKVNSVQNIYTAFAYSDHGPVVMNFELIG